MRWFRRRTQRPQWHRPDLEETPAVGGERMVFWKAKEQVDGEDYGPVWIVDANDPNLTLEEPDVWLSWTEAEEFARRRGLPLEDV